MLKKLTGLRNAAQVLRGAPAARRDRVLHAAAELLVKRQAEILKANLADLKALKGDVTNAFKDRLTLNPARIGHMAESLRQVAALADPVDEVVDEKTLRNGLVVRRLRSPLGVILMIFESRPNVAIEAFSLAFKSGNVIILRGGKESMKTTAVLYKVIAQALETESLPKDCLWGITDPDRKITHELLKQRRYIDVVVPRGGDKLIEYVVENSEIPIIKNDRGLCHVYVHEDADLAMAASIVENSKCQRPGVCNSMETVLVHERVARELLPALYDRMSALAVEWFVDPKARAILKGRKRVKAATAKSFDTEYLDLRLSCRVVSSLDQAIEHIERHGSRHSESIITRSASAARAFQGRVDAAAVYWNASTRFTDGFELGLGGELGISTQKLHVRGPVGLRELTSTRWVIDGTGQTRG